MRVIFYIIFAISLLFIPLIPEKKSVQVSVTQKSRSIDITLTKPVKKEKPLKKQLVQKKMNKVVKKRELKRKKEIIKKRVIKKQLTKQPTKPVIKKVIPKEIKPKPVVTKVIEKKVDIKKQQELLQKEKIQKEQELLRQKNIAIQEAKSARLKAQKESYYSLVYNKIAQKKRYPKKALRFKQEGEVKVAFKILENGKISGFKILEKSDNNIFNKAVKKLFRQLKRVTAPPSEIDIPVEITITIKYDIK